MEEIVPHSVTLLVLLQEYCRGLYDDPEIDKDETEAEEPWPPPTRHAISKILIRDIQAASSAAATPHNLTALLDELRQIIIDGPELASLVSDTLMQIESPEEVLEHTDSLRELISPSTGGKGVLDPNGLLGLYIRRILLTFDKMDFPQISKLYRRIQQYKNVNRSNVTMTRGNGSMAGESFSMSASFRDDDDDHDGDDNAAVMGRPTANTALLSSREAGQVFRRARELAARGVPADDFIRQLGTSPESMVHLPLAHYVRHLQCVQKKDMTGALENLYRYFDLQAVNATKGAGAGGPSKSYFHYATLSLAALHHKFGNDREAVQFVLETVKIAQENLDHRCLQHALGWLARLEEGKSSVELARLFVQNTQTDESKPGRYLHCLAQLTYAKKLFTEGHLPATVLTVVSSGYGISVLEGQDELIGMSYMLHSGLFDLYGHSNLTMLYAQLHLRNRDPGAAEDGCEAYCKLASHYFVQGNRELAYRILGKAEALYPPGTPTATLWLALRWQFDHQAALYGRDWATAVQVGDLLAATFGKDAAGTRADVSFRAALYNRERERYDVAASILKKLGDGIKADPAQSRRPVPLSSIKRVRILLLLAEIMFETGNHVAAVEVVVEADRLAESLSLLLAVAQAKLLLAEVRIALNDIGAARRDLQAATPRLLAHGSLEDKGRMHLVTGKLNAVVDPSAAGMVAAVRSFLKARAAFATLGAQRLELRCLYCLARAYDVAGNVEDRDRCAAGYSDLTATGSYHFE